MNREYLSSLGVRICLQGHQPIMAGYRAVHETLKALREGVPPASLKDVPDKEWMASFSREAEYARWIEEYLD
jgi:carboxyvinyl-carboxyphosphonate phosphorylmutase